MNNILTYSDFTIDISLPIDKTSIDILNSYITKYQEEYLINLLGYTLYKEFITNISLVTPATKWTNLLNGIEYQDYSDDNELQTVKYEGLKKFLKYFVYYHYVNDLQQKITTTGMIEQQNENSSVVPATTKIIEAYNKGVKYYGQKILTEKEFRFNSSALQTGINNGIIEKQNQKLVPSVYNFLRRQNELDATNYQKWIFTEIEKLSIYSI